MTKEQTGDERSVASERDLAAMYAVYYSNEVGEAENIPPMSLQNVLAVLRHVFETGMMSVAEQEGRVLGFAGAITRGPVTFLTDLFVHPQIQSSGLGKTLLQQVLPQRLSLIRCTMSSTDPRAQSLYTRQGMQPLFPHFNLQWRGRVHTEPLATDLEVVEGEAGHGVCPVGCAGWRTNTTSGSRFLAGAATRHSSLVSTARRYAWLWLCAASGRNLAHSSDLGGRPGGSERARIRNGVRPGGYKICGSASSRYSSI